MNPLEYVAGEVRRQLAEDQGLAGVLLLGSISAGMDDETSDYDILLVFTDEAMAAHPEYRETTLRLDRKADVWSATLSELAAYDRHGYDVRELLHAQYPIDPEGTLRKIVEERVHYPAEEIPPLVSARLDSYYDGVFRSLKCFRHGFTFGGYQMAARSMEFFVETLWALNGRVMPVSQSCAVSAAHAGEAALFPGGNPAADGAHRPGRGRGKSVEAAGPNAGIYEGTGVLSGTAGLGRRIGKGSGFTQGERGLT